jgi:hypothetical protein
MEHLAINVFDDIPTTSTVDLSKVTEMAQRLINMDRAIENREMELERLKVQRVQLATVDLPELMGSIGMSDVGLDNGYRIEVEDFLKASLPSKDSIDKAKGDDREILIQRREGAFSWLRDHKAGDLIKYEVKIAFDKGKPIQGLLNMLKRWKGIAVKHEETVHFKTLEKYVKEQVADGTDIPFDLFGVWVGKMAKVISPKK